MATHSSILAWRIPWTEEPDRLQSMGSQSRTQLSDWARTHTGCDIAMHFDTIIAIKIINISVPPVPFCSELQPPLDSFWSHCLFHKMRAYKGQVHETEWLPMFCMFWTLCDCFLVSSSHYQTLGLYHRYRYMWASPSIKNPRMEPLG